MIRVVTGMWGTAWERYGRKFAETFEMYWDKDVELLIFTDKELPVNRGFLVDISSVPGYDEFLRHWEAVEPKKDGWKWDAKKWFPQALCPAVAASSMPDGSILVWLDADVETTEEVPSSWIKGVLGEADVACLRRVSCHTEIGFYAMRLGEGTRWVLNEFSRLYSSGEVFTLKEWHSAYAWDEAMSRRVDLRVRNLSPGMRHHVWPNTVLAKKMVHHKGHRKPGGG